MDAMVEKEGLLQRLQRRDKELKASPLGKAFYEFKRANEKANRRDVECEIMENTTSRSLRNLWNEARVAEETFVNLLCAQLGIK